MKKLLALTLLIAASLSLSASITLTPTAVDTGYCEASYSCKVTATGGTAPYTYTVSSGTLPSGLKIAKATGVISGIVHLHNDTSITFVVTAHDKNNAQGFRSYTMYIVNKVVTWEQNVAAWANVGNTPPTYSQVYNTYRTSLNNVMYSENTTSVIIPYGRNFTSPGGAATFHLGAGKSQYFNLRMLGTYGYSNIKGDSLSMNIKYTSLAGHTSNVYIDSTKVNILAHDSIRINAVRLQLAGLPSDSTGLTSGQLYKSGNTLKIKY